MSLLPLRQTSLTSHRCPIIPSPLPSVRSTPLPLFDSSLVLEEYPFRTSYHYPLVSFTFHQRIPHPRHLLLLSPSALTKSLQLDSTEFESRTRRRFALSLCFDLTMGQPFIYAPRGDQYIARRANGWESGKRMGGRGRQR